MYNNKQYRTSQKSFQEGLSNVQEYLSNVGEKTKGFFEGLGSLGTHKNDDVSKAINALKSGDKETARPILEKLLAQGKDIAVMFAPYVGGDLAAYKLFQSMGLVPAAGLSGAAALAAGGAGLLGAEGAMALAENIKGDLEIYKDYQSDYNKDLDALSALYPKNQDLQELINVMRVYAEDGLKAITDAKNKKANRKKNYRIAIVGEANWGSYAHQGLSGAAMGAATGGGLIGAGIGGLGMALADASKDIFHNLQSDEYKAAAYTNELVEKTQTMVNQLAKYDELTAMKLQNLAKEFDTYVRKYIYKEKDLEEPKNLTGYLEQLKKFNSEKK
jgi:hypothetical protein